MYTLKGNMHIIYIYIYGVPHSLISYEEPASYNDSRGSMLSGP